MAGVNLNLQELSPADQRILKEWDRRLEKSLDEGRVDGMFAELPPPGSALRLHLLVRLIKAHMIYIAQRGTRPGVDFYVQKYEELRGCDEIVNELNWLEEMLPEPEEAPPTVAPAASVLADEGTTSLQEDGDLTPDGESQTLISSFRQAIPDPLPEYFGRYHIRRKLGAGNMGTVYLADDTQLDRPVALKVPLLRPEDGSAPLGRFFKEAKAAAKLNHPNVCPVHDVGECNGVPYLTMAFIDGQPLSEVVAKEGPLGQERAAEIVRKLALGLEAAHQSHVLHRDLKPTNVLLTGQGEPVVMDFGMAKRLEQLATIKTEPGANYSTLPYMAPEQFEADAGAAGDIYSLGVILYELLTGQVPHQGTPSQVVLQILTEPAVPPSVYRRDVHPDLEAICRRAMAKKPSDRYPTMAAFAADLGRWLRRSIQETGHDHPLAVPDQPALESIRFPPEERQHPRRRFLVVALSAVGGVLLTAGLVVMALLNREPAQATSPERPEQDSAGPKVAVALVRGEQTHNLIGHDDWVTSVAITADGRWGVSGSYDGTVRYWDLQEGRQLAALKGHAGTVLSVALARDGRRACSAGSDGTLRLWNLGKQEKEKPLLGHAGWVQSVALSVDGKQALTGGADGQAVFWDLETGESLQRIPAHAGPVQSVAQAADGQHFLSGGTDGTVRWWDVQAAKCLRKLEGHRGTVWSVAVTADGHRALSAGADGTVRLWDVGQEKLLHTFDQHTGEVSCVIFSPDERLGISAGADGAIRFWDLDQRQEAGKLTGHANRVLSIAVSADGRLVLSGGADRAVRLWRIHH